MNWIEKVRYLYDRDKNEQPGDPFFYDICFTGNDWQPGELEALHQTYPWLPQSYIYFLAEFDGISVSFCRFYGSEKGKAISLKETFDEEAGPCLAAGYFPFGRDADGSMFIFDKAGKIYWWDKYDYEFEETPKLLAESLEQFVEECLMGKRYIEFNNVERDNYYPFLKSMNWA
jgi:hypothetical protein